jgi:hypothetical protein
MINSQILYSTMAKQKAPDARLAKAEEWGVHGSTPQAQLSRWTFGEATK